jgi:hypothetical protein
MNSREYRDRLGFEHELINRRLTWLLTSQTILFAAAGLALGEKSDKLKVEPFIKVVAISGAVIASLILVGIVAAILAKIPVWNDYRSQEGRKNEPFGARTEITFVAFLPDIFYQLFSWSHGGGFTGALPTNISRLCMVYPLRWVSFSLSRLLFGKSKSKKRK